MLTREGKKSAVIHSAVFVVWVALVVLASFKDLEISNVLTKSGGFGEWFGAIFADIGQWPAYLILPFATCVFFYNVENMSHKKGGYITLKILFAVLHVLGWFIFFSGIERYNALIEVNNGIYKMDKLLALTYAVIVSVPCLYFAKFVDRKLMQRLLKFAVFTVIVLLVTQILTNVTKVFWSRARYRDMLAHNSFDMFTPWYHPNGIREVEGYKLTSFPSGHVNSATNIFVIVVLADVLPALKDKKPALYISSSVFVVLTMISRVMFKAHFLSDTLFAVMISYLAFFIIKLIFFRGGKYVYSSKKDGEDTESADNDLGEDMNDIVVNTEYVSNRIQSTMEQMNHIKDQMRLIFKLKEEELKAKEAELETQAAADNSTSELLDNNEIVLDNVDASEDEEKIEEPHEKVIDESQDLLDYMTKDEEEK